MKWWCHTKLQIKLEFEMCQVNYDINIPAIYWLILFS